MDEQQWQTVRQFIDQQIAQGRSRSDAYNQAAYMFGLPAEQVMRGVESGLGANYTPNMVGPSPGGSFLPPGAINAGWVQGQQDQRRYGGTPITPPNAAGLQPQQDMRRYGGSPSGAGAPGGTYESFMRNAYGAMYGPWWGNQLANMALQPGRYPPSSRAPAPQEAPPPDPLAWAQGSMWQYRPGGQGPFAGVPSEYWEDVQAQLGAALPWAQLQQYAANDQAARDQWLMEFQRSGNQWGQQFGAGQEQAGFDRWLAQQQLALQQGQAGQDNSWRNRQLDLQSQQQGWQQGFSERDWNAQQAQLAWQNAFNQRQFDTGVNQWDRQFQAGRDDTRWQQGFSERQFGEDTRRWDIGQNNWQQQFQAGRDDALWNRGFSERQFGEGVRQFDTTMERNRALDQWSQAFSQAQFDWGKQRAVETDQLQREGQAMASFGRRFGPAVGSM